MTKYLFRGKKADGEWTYGQAVTIGGKSVIYRLVVTDGQPPHFEKDKVPTDSIGLRTGLQDRKGNNIWEGDILDGDIGTSCSFMRNNNFQVLYRDGAFYAQNKTQSVLLNKIASRSEIIGNVIDNPERLE